MFHLSASLDAVLYSLSDCWQFERDRAYRGGHSGLGKEPTTSVNEEVGEAPFLQMVLRLRLYWELDFSCKLETLLFYRSSPIISCFSEDILLPNAAS